MISKDKWIKWYIDINYSYKIFKKYNYNLYK